MTTLLFDFLLWRRNHGSINYSLSSVSWRRCSLRLLHFQPLNCWIMAFSIIRNQGEITKRCFFLYVIRVVFLFLFFPVWLSIVDCLHQTRQKRKKWKSQSLYHPHLFSSWREVLFPISRGKWEIRLWWTHFSVEKQVCVGKGLKLVDISHDVI